MAHGLLESSASWKPPSGLAPTHRAASAQTMPIRASRSSSPVDCQIWPRVCDPQHDLLEVVSLTARIATYLYACQCCTMPSCQRLQRGTKSEAKGWI